MEGKAGQQNRTFLRFRPNRLCQYSLNMIKSLGLTNAYPGSYLSQDRNLDLLTSNNSKIRFVIWLKRAQEEWFHVRGICKSLPRILELLPLCPLMA